MSPKYSHLTAGLTVLGVFGIAVVHAARTDDAPAPPGPAPAPAAAPAPSHSVLLLSDGRTLEGSITAEGAEYVLRKHGGEIRFKKTQVVQAFRSMAEVYEYKRAQFLDDDPDEHLKLARWCLSQNMKAEAKAELQKVVAISPRSGEARAMLSSLAATEARLASSTRVDTDVVQTGGEAVEPAGPSRKLQRPGELDPETLRAARKEMGVSGWVIFELPPALAVKRADQYARTVHRVLQARCARCHNEKYEGAFQLVEVKSRKDLTQPVLRNNLDATLQIIDKDNPARSELLSRALVPHGNGQVKRPIFSGSNDPEFQIIAAWVNSLRAAPSPGAARDSQVSPASASRFASERTAAPLSFTPTPSGAAVSPAAAGPRLPSNVTQEVITPPATRYVPGRGMVVENVPPSNEKFPVSPLLGGPPLKPAGGAAPAGPAARPGAPGQPATGIPPKAAAGLPGADLPPLPADDPAANPAGKPAKPVKVDPNLLQQLLINRNLGR